jgi:hypothetical protein
VWLTCSVPTHRRDVPAHQDGRARREQLADPAATQHRGQRLDERIDRVVVPGQVAAVACKLPQIVRRARENLDQVRKDRDPVVRLVKDRDRALKQKLLLDVRGCGTKNRDQRADHREPAAARVSNDVRPRLSRQPVSSLQRLRGIKNVQVAATTTETNHVPAERLDDSDVVRLQIPKDQGDDLAGREPEDHAAHQTGLPEPGQPEHERARVAD